MTVFVYVYMPNTGVLAQTLDPNKISQYRGTRVLTSLLLLGRSCDAPQYVEKGMENPKSKPLMRTGLVSLSMGSAGLGFRDV